jgi:protein-S-isoprenylcysteine O-methyltransferase Ste14
MIDYLCSVPGIAFTVGSYAYFFWTLPLAASAFLLNLSHQHENLKPYLPYNIDHGTEVENSLMNNLFHLSVWAIAHSIFARDSIKVYVTKIIPQHLERPLYVFQSSYLLHNVIKNWSPMNQIVYETPDDYKNIFVGFYIFGWLFLVSSTFALDHFDLFGLRQGLKMGNMLKFAGSENFVTLFHYKLVRHPIMTGFFIMFWSVPVMTMGHLLFSAVASAYIIIAIKFLEEPTLIRKIGPEYEEYMETTPAFCPFLKMRSTKKPKAI